jgi:hypothetical protein
MRLLVLRFGAMKPELRWCRMQMFNVVQQFAQTQELNRVRSFAPGVSLFRWSSVVTASHHPLADCRAVRIHQFQLRPRRPR